MTPKQIRKLRRKLGMTQEQFAKHVGAHRVSVARWETGASEPTGPAQKLLELMAKMHREQR